MKKTYGKAKYHNRPTGGVRNFFMDDEQIALELIRLREDDLAVRERLQNEGKLTDGYCPEMERVHLRNAARLEQIVAQHGYPTISRVGSEASGSAWMIIQHAISRPRFMKQMLARLRQLPPGEVDPKNLAYLDDRIRMFEGRKQRYGTQFDWDDDGLMSPVACDDPDRVNARRRKLGMASLEETTAVFRRNQERLPPDPWLERHRAQYRQWLLETGWRKPAAPAAADELMLVRPDFSMEAAVADYRREHFRCGERELHGSSRLDRLVDYRTYLAHLENNSKTTTVTPGWVVSDTFCAIRRRDGRLVGMITVRHDLNDFLRRCGGHIGYGVRPSERRKGYATRMLQWALDYCRHLGLPRVLISCDRKNEASQRTIRRCGGRLEREITAEGAVMQIFWIDL